MPPKWKLINTYYFTLWKSNPVVNNVERHLHMHFSLAAYKNSYRVKAIYVNIGRKQSQEAQLSEGMLKRLTT